MGNLIKKLGGGVDRRKDNCGMQCIFWGVNLLMSAQSLVMLNRQSATKMMFTCPKQVILAYGQVGYQSYLFFGQLNIQEVIKKTMCFNIVKCKTDHFSQKYLTS